MSDLTSSSFRLKLTRALKVIEKILDTQRQQRKHPETCSHTYTDKFALAESACRASLGAFLNFFTILGLDKKSHDLLLKWHHTKDTISVRFEYDETCTFVKEQNRDVERSEKVVVHKSGFLGLGARDVTETHKVITTVTDYYWTLKGTWKIVAFRGAWNGGGSSTSAALLHTRSYAVDFKTSAKNPRPLATSDNSSWDLNLTWLLDQAKPDGSGYDFTIDRSDPKLCKTPRRNVQVDDAVAFFKRAKAWVAKIPRRVLLHTDLKHGEFRKKRALSVKGIDPFPLVVAAVTMEDPPSSSSSSSSVPSAAMGGGGASKEEASSTTAGSPPLGRLVTSQDFALFVEEHERSLHENLNNFKNVHTAASDRTCPTSCDEVRVAFACNELSNLADTLVTTLGEIERMLRRQVIKAIGKVVTPNDFAEYMNFHYSRLFRGHYALSPVCYAVREGGKSASPQGVFGLEIDDVPVRTATRMFAGASGNVAAKSFPLNAACEVRFSGPTYVHAAILHRFADSDVPNLKLVARARQFSSFVLLVGTVMDAKRFAPKAAMILRNKDDLRIPLMLETLPTAKEFRDAIESLSPEQQRFCKAYRSMQLGSTVFAFAVLQIRPQIEKVLNMAKGSLTKEIELTESLTNLFVEYQVSPDLLSYDPSRADDRSIGDVEAVRRNSKRVEAIIAEEKRKELEEAKKREEKRRLVTAEVLSEHASFFRKVAAGEEDLCGAIRNELDECSFDFEEGAIGGSSKISDILVRDGEVVEPTEAGASTGKSRADANASKQDDTKRPTDDKSTP
eukprot:g5477.t1